MIEDIRRIADHFGVENQNMKAIEELAELQQAIARMAIEKSNTQTYANLIEEMADVEILLEQVRYQHEIERELIEGIKRMKIDRTLNRYGIGECEDEI